MYGMCESTDIQHSVIFRACVLTSPFGRTYITTSDSPCSAATSDMTLRTFNRYGLMQTCAQSTVAFCNFSICRKNAFHMWTFRNISCKGEISPKMYSYSYIKQSHYSPGQAQRVPGGWGSQISRQSAHEVDKVVSPTHRPPLPPRKYSWYSFLLEAVDPRATVRPEGFCQWKIPITASGIEPATFRLVAQCLNQLCHRVPRYSYIIFCLLLFYISETYGLNMQLFKFAII